MTDKIKAYQLSQVRQKIYHLFNICGADPSAIYRHELEAIEDDDRSRLFLSGMDIVLSAYYIYQEEHREELKEMAIDYADFLIEKFANKEGHFVEYEKAPWLTDDQLWFTIPWGTAFSGNKMVDVFQSIGSDLSAEQYERWQIHLKNTGKWLYKNPVLGSYVFNCTIHLCYLLWRIGNELGDKEWKLYALQAGKLIIEKYVDQEGWIHGEHGVSPHYQLLGSDHLARFAWETQDADLLSVNHKLANCIINYSTPTLYWNGNFGTRSNALGQIGNTPGQECLLVSSATGNKQACYLIHEYGNLRRRHKIELLEQALGQTPQPPSYKKLQHFHGIESSILRIGSWQAWFCNYSKSLWARGFVGLWNEELGQPVFSTLHSLPTVVPKAKLRLGDTQDWAGFPHIMVQRDGQAYNSHQRIENLEMNENGYVSWEEMLSSKAGECGGRMVCKCEFQYSALSMHINLDQLVGKTIADFHIMRAKDQYFALWVGDNLAAIEDGELPERNHRELEFAPDKYQKIGFQINNKLFCFRFNEIPDGSKIAAGLLEDEGLHTKNHGGVRLRIELPANSSSGKLDIDFYEL